MVSRWPSSPFTYTLVSLNNKNEFAEIALDVDVDLSLFRWSVESVPIGPGELFPSTSGMTLSGRGSSSRVQRGMETIGTGVAA